MSITRETANANINKAAVLCCRTLAGSTIEPKDLEDPAIFSDLIDTGLLDIPADTLSIGDALGKTLTRTMDSLSPITVRDIKEHVNITTEAEEVNNSWSNSHVAVIKSHLAAGTSLEESHFVNPSILPDLINSGLVSITETESITIEQAVGNALVHDMDAFSQIRLRDMAAINTNQASSPENKPVIKNDNDEKRDNTIENWVVNGSEKSFIEAFHIVGKLISAYEHRINVEQNMLKSTVERLDEEIEIQKRQNNQHAADSMKMVTDEASRKKADYVSKLNELGKLQDQITLLFNAKPFSKDIISRLNRLGALHGGIKDAIAEYEKILGNYKSAMSKKIDEERRVNEESANDKYRYEKENALNKSDKTIKEYQKAFSNEVNNNINPEKIDHFKKMIQGRKFEASNYKCSNDLETAIYFGEGKKVYSHEKPLGIDRIFTDGDNPICKRETDTSMSLSLPYFQTLEEGISFFIEHNQTDRIKAQEIIRSLVLKTYMSFPPGKVEATMIDPLELGETFSIFSKLGEETGQPRIIDEKIWSQENDITRSVNTLRGKIENVTQAYGDNKAARLKKEPIRVLAITDFPTGFTANALKDLEAIVRKSVSSGVCIYIACNTLQIERLKDTEKSIYDEIKSILHVCKLNNSAVTLLSERDKKESIQLKIDNISASENAIKEIVQKISKEIGSNETGKLVTFDEMYPNISGISSWSWNSSDVSRGLQIPIGIKGADNIVRLSMGRQDGSTEHHALITGQTGAGKTSFLHTIIMSTMLSYTYDQVQMYLVDFKEGVEFSSYIKYRLPYFRLIAVNSEKEFGRNVLKELVGEFEKRIKAFKDKDVVDISAYNRLDPTSPMPYLLLIFDEVQELFNGDDLIDRECIGYLKTLVTEGRAVGIHIILASSNFNLANGLNPIFELMAIRIAIKGTPEPSARTILSSENNITNLLKNESAGAAVFNNQNGAPSGNSIFQIAYLNKEERIALLEAISSRANEMAAHNNYYNRTRVLLTNLEDDIDNPLNAFIDSKTVDDAMKYGKDDYPLFIGEPLNFNRELKIQMTFEKGDNLLVATKDERGACSLIQLMMTSILYGELTKKSANKNDKLIYLLDCSDDEETSVDGIGLKEFANHFESQIERFKFKEVGDAIDSLYSILQDRKDKGVDASYEKLFIVFFGIDRAKVMRSDDSLYDISSGANDISIHDKYRELILDGNKYGICTIVWTQNFNIFKKMFGNILDKGFDKRIAYNISNEAMEDLVNESEPEKLNNRTAVYMDINSVRNKHFRRYETLQYEWIRKYAEAYHEYASQQ